MRDQGQCGHGADAGNGTQPCLLFLQGLLGLQNITACHFDARNLRVEPSHMAFSTVTLDPLGLMKACPLLLAHGHELVTPRVKAGEHVAGGIVRRLS